VYKTDHTLFSVPKLKTPGTVPPFPHIFLLPEGKQFFITILHSLHTHQSLCKYTKEASFLMDVFRNCSFSTKQCACLTFAWMFPANRPLVWCKFLDSLILAFLNSVGLPSRINKLIIIQVNKLQVMEPSNQVWHHTPATPRGRLSTSQASLSATLPYDESIYWQTIRNFSAQNVV